MNNMQMRKILADKLKEEGSALGWNSINILKQEVEYEDDIAVYRVIIDGYEHIHFIIHLTKSKLFGNEVWVSERTYYGAEEPESTIIVSEESKKLEHDTLLRSVLREVGYHIALTF